MRHEFDLSMPLRDVLEPRQFVDPTDGRRRAREDWVRAVAGTGLAGGEGREAVSSVRAWVLLVLASALVGGGMAWLMLGHRYTEPSGGSSRVEPPRTERDAVRSRIRREPAERTLQPVDAALPGSWRDAVLQVSALGDAAFDAQHAEELASAQRAIREPAVRGAIVQEALRLDASGDVRALADLLGVVGRCADTPLLLSLIDASGRATADGTTLFALAVALDRGTSEPDPAGFQVRSRVGSVGEITEAAVVDALVAQARPLVTAAGDGDTVARSVGVVTALALAAHRSPAADALLRELAGRGDGLGAVVRAAYLMRARTPAAWGLALETLADSDSTAEELQGAMVALARHGVDRDEIERYVVAIVRSAGPERRSALIGALPWLVSVAGSAPGGPSFAVFALLREELRHADIRVRSAAAVAITTSVLRSGRGWAVSGTTGRALVEDDSLLVQARRNVLGRWARSYFLSGGDDAGVRAVALNRDLEPALRDALWQDLAEAAQSMDERRRLARLAREVLSEERDIDIRSTLERLASVE